MDYELVRLIGSYVIALVIFGFAGWMLVATGEIPDAWANLVAIAAGFLFAVDGIERTIARRNSKKE